MATIKLTLKAEKTQYQPGEPVAFEGGIEADAPVGVEVVLRRLSPDGLGVEKVITPTVRDLQPGVLVPWKQIGSPVWRSKVPGRYVFIATAHPLNASGTPIESPVVIIDVLPAKPARSEP